MTRATLAKLLILVILAFIICLPEFFTLYRASKVNFLCLHYRTCEQSKNEKTEDHENADRKRGDMCDPSHTLEDEEWEQACTQENQTNMTDPVPHSSASKDPESWFICETDKDMTGSYRNHSSSALSELLEVSLKIQLRNADILNLTMYGLSDLNSLHLHPLEEDDEEEEGMKKDNERQKMTFYCCHPAPRTSESAGPSRCLLWMANQTVFAATATEKQPLNWTQKGEWRCVFRVLWLVLLGVVLMTILLTLLGQIYRERYKNPKLHPLDKDLTGNKLNDDEKHTDIIAPKGMIHCNQLNSELSTIQEVENPDDIETLLNGNMDHSHTVLENLHHRCHHLIPSHSAEQARWQSTSLSI